jgi:outer membrane protein OmpA-like peptidoglycan-associated protein
MRSALALASVSLAALGALPAFAKDPDQTLEDLLGVSPAAEVSEQDKSLTIISPEPEAPPPPAIAERKPAAAAAELPAVPATAPASATIAATVPLPDSPPERKPVQPLKAAAKTAPDNRMPSAVLRTSVGKPATAPQNMASGSPIGKPAPLPELLRDLRNASPSAAPLPKPAAVATAESSISLPDPAAKRALHPDPVSGFNPEAASTPAPAPTSPISALAGISPVPALPSHRAAELGLNSVNPAPAATHLFASTGNKGEYTVSVADLLGNTTLPLSPAPATETRTVSESQSAITPVTPTPPEKPAAAPLESPAAKPQKVFGASTATTAPRPLIDPQAKADVAAAAPLAADDLVDRFIFTAFSSSLPGAIRNSLSDKVLPALRQQPKLKVQISGFADWTPNGSVEASTAISERRAENVARFLREQGIAPERLHVRGVGVDFLPGAPRDRVDITVVAP